MTTDAQRPWRVLLVEDNEQQAATTAGSLERRPVSSSGERAAVDRVTDFSNAIRQIEDRRYDLIILDIRDQEAAEVEPPGDQASSGDEATSADKGLELYTEIRRRRFLPIVFYSAVANLAAHLDDPPFVSVVSKFAAEDDLLRDKVTAVFDSRLPLLNRALAFHVDDVLRDFMINFVEHSWADLSGQARRGDLAYLMVRRLARSLDATFVAELAEATVRSSEAMVHPTRLYIMPPLQDPSTGDIVRDDTGKWFIVLTPTCDLFTHSGRRRADNVMVAACVLLTDTDEYRTWIAAGMPLSDNTLYRLIGNRQGQQDRLYFLPSAWGMPDLVVDLQCISHLKYDDFARLTRVATLDDPYAQALIARFGRYCGRVGTPDLDVTAVRQRLQPVTPMANEETASRPEPEQGTASGPVEDGTSQAPADQAEAAVAVDTNEPADGPEPEQGTAPGPVEDGTSQAPADQAEVK